MVAGEPEEPEERRRGEPRISRPTPTGTTLAEDMRTAARLGDREPPAKRDRLLSGVTGVDSAVAVDDNLERMVGSIDETLERSVVVDEMLERSVIDDTRGPAGRCLGGGMFCLALAA